MRTCDLFSQIVTFLALTTTLLNIWQMTKRTWPLRQTFNQPDETYNKKVPEIAGPMSSGKFKIPKILHHTWKNRTLPGKYHQTWIHMHPEWTHHLWTDEENRELVKQHYPWLLKTFDEVPLGVMRADISRYLYVHRYGGLYTDLDMEPLRNLNFLFDEAKAPITLGYMSSEFGDRNNLQPGFLMSVPGHPFWMHMVLDIMAAVQHAPKTARPDYVTGPTQFYECIERYGKLHEQMASKSHRQSLDDAKMLGSVNVGSEFVWDIHILKPGLIYPYHWNQLKTDLGRICAGVSDKQDEEACKSHFKEAYTIQYSGYSWRNDWEGFLASQRAKETIF